MSKHLLRLSLLTAAFIPTAAALAADLDVPPPPPPVDNLRSSTYDWTGVSVGVFAAANALDGHYAFTEQCFDYADGQTTVTTGGVQAACSEVDPEMSGIGYGGGLRAAVDYQVGDVVFGVVGDWQLGKRLADNDDPVAATYVDMKHMATARGRLGWALNETMLYGTAGLAVAQMNYGGFIPDATGVESNDPEWTYGLAIGGGIEHAVTDNLSVGLEYIFTKYKATDHYLTDGNTTIPTADTAGGVVALGEGDVHQIYDGFHSIRAGVNYRFSM